MRSKYPPTINISAIGLADAYYKLTNTTLKEGALKKRFYGKPVNTYDIISLTEIRYPMLEPMLHPDFPTKELHLEEYKKQWDRYYDWKNQGFEYNYMDRLVSYPTICEKKVGDNFNKYYHKSNFKWFIDQLKIIKENINKRIENSKKSEPCLVSNRDQVITWIPDRDLFVNEDQPCLQRIQFFVYEYPQEYKTNYCTLQPVSAKKGKAEFHVMWRSRDLYSAWNSNMIGLITMLNKEIFEPNNLELIRVIDFCNSLHIYESDWESAKLIKPAQINPQLLNN